jgi:hypothetical protein
VETDLLRRAARSLPTEATLVAYIERVLRIPCPDTVVVPGHQTPGDHVRAMWRGDRSTVTIASRGSFKTLLTAAAEFLLALHRGLRIIHFAQYDSQAEQAWRYVTEFAARQWFEGLVRISKTEIGFPGSGGLIEFRPLTIANARSAHVPVVVFDEADEMDPEILRIARFTTGSKGAEQARVHYISTYSYPDGIIDRLVRLAPERGIGIYRWNFKEASAPCPDSRSGTTPVDVWVHPKTLLHRMDQPSDGEWRRVTVLDGCLACPLVASCRGDLKRARGAVPIATLLDQRNDPSYAPHVWRSQMDNEAPSVEGLAVPEWDRDLSVTEDAEYDPALPVFMGVDFGTSHPAAVVLGQMLPLGHGGNNVRGRIRIFAEHVVAAPFHPAITDWIAREWVPRYGLPKRTFIDPSGAPVADRVTVAGRTLMLEKAFSNKHKVGYDALRGHCTPTIEDGRPKLLVHPRCTRLIHEFGTVRYSMNRDGTYSTDIMKVGDDALDAARYLIVSLSESVPFTPQEVDRAFARMREVFPL